MKTSVFAICVALLFSCQQQTKATENVKETLKAVVVGETVAYVEKDYEKWASYWDHGTDVLRLNVSKTGFNQKRGWEESKGDLESYFKDHPEPITSTFVNSNYLIFHEERLAWVAFDQTWTKQSGEKSVAKATITLIKKKNDWKIISYTAILYEPEKKNVATLEKES